MTAITLVALKDIIFREHLKNADFLDAQMPVNRRRTPKGLIVSIPYPVYIPLSLLNFYSHRLLTLFVYCYGSLPESAIPAHLYSRGLDALFPLCTLGVFVPCFFH